MTRLQDVELNAQEILTQARARETAREARRVPIDYAASNRAFKRQKSALTRAINSGDSDKVVLACTKAVREWSQAPFEGAWPDDWSRWQRALDDALPWNQGVALEDLR